MHVLTMWLVAMGLALSPFLLQVLNERGINLWKTRTTTATTATATTAIAANASTGATASSSDGILAVRCVVCGVKCEACAAAVKQQLEMIVSVSRVCVSRRVHNNNNSENHERETTAEITLQLNVNDAGADRDECVRVVVDAVADVCDVLGYSLKEHYCIT